MQTLRTIGVIHSSLKRLEDCPLQEYESAVPATIGIHDEYVRGLSHIKPGDELIVLTWLHKADRSVLSTHPRNDASAPLTGVFSTRSPDRPNPIGMHVVTVLSRDEGVVKVSGLEVLDQTPVVDIKPVI